MEKKTIGFFINDKYKKSRPLFYSWRTFSLMVKLLKLNLLESVKNQFFLPDSYDFSYFRFANKKFTEGELNL
ncbi:hypothetical protein CNR22_00190 [Sphingobacteriaceae bacterium]|nr:hypothetical protein CNR22_00190 [Sphingobacteriaceae bacterium]